MTAVTADVAPRAKLSNAVVPLLALAVFINYVDRGNLATAGPLIKDELRLSASSFGLIVSAFYWTYTPGQVLAGWMAERFNAYRTLAIGLALWSLATFTTGFAAGFAILLGLRLLLGLGEAAIFPCSAKLMAANLPHHKLGAANGLVVAGTALGPAFGTAVGGVMMAAAGWRPSFLIFGLVSLAWLIPWLLVSRQAARSAPPTPEAPPAYGEMLRRREVWGAGLGHFSNNYSHYFIITWLPLYLVKSRGFSMTEMAALGGLVYLLQGTSAIVMGWVADRVIAAGVAMPTVRKLWVTLSHLLAAAGLVTCAFSHGSAAIVALFVAAFGLGLNASTMYAIGQTLAGPRAGGAWMGLQNGLGNVAGIVGPLVTGLIVDRTGAFDLAFGLGAVVALAGIPCWLLLIPKLAPIAWAPAQRGS